LKISLNWIKNYVNLDGIATDQIVDKLTISGLEVEEVEDKGKEFDNIVIGFVKEKKKHPNADKLSVCIVTDGQEDFNVVCGAPNVDAGQKVAFAKIGAVIPNGGFVIAKARLRGEVSMGMICSASELGLSDDHAGILVLDSELKEGQSLSEALGLNDTVLEVGITPNRPDALSHIGVARDVAALFNRELKLPEINIKGTSGDINSVASVEILNLKGCPRYTAKVVRNVKVKESPVWLKNRLTSIGLRPINNIVDITNFILHETGQPLHAFDLDKVEGHKIIVRSAEDGETFVTLDSKERKLVATDLVICDAKRSVAIAGVMGGENSEITSETKNILIESAYFNSSDIRKTAKKLALSTDASYRFERGTDPGNTLYVAERAAELMALLGEGEILNGAIDVYPNKIERLKVSLRFARITKILGFEIANEDVKLSLRNLGFEIAGENETSIEAIVPTFRPDVEREIDLIEEVARIYGYDKIPAVEKIAITLEKKTDQSAFKDILRTAANSLGFYEIISNSLQPAEIASVTGRTIDMLNPQSFDMASLRTSLLQGALYAVAKNINVGEKNLTLFEIGNVFNKLTEGEIKSFNDFSEVEKIMFVITGKADVAKWYCKERNFDIYDMKGLVNSFLGSIGPDNILNDSYSYVENKYYDFILEKTFENHVVGFGGLVKKDILKIFDIQQEVFAFEFNIADISGVTKPVRKFSELLKYPKITRDCAFILDKNILGEEVTKLIYNSGSQLLKKVELFDIFESGNLGINKKSMAFSLEYYDVTRTLKDEEVEKDFNKAVEAVKLELKAEFRGA